MTSLFKSPKAPDPPPPVPSVAELPDPDDVRKKALAARRIAQSGANRGGFQDTILSSLGGG